MDQSIAEGREERWAFLGGEWGRKRERRDGVVEGWEK